MLHTPYWIVGQTKLRKIAHNPTYEVKRLKTGCSILRPKNDPNWHIWTTFRFEQPVPPILPSYILPNRPYERTISNFSRCWKFYWVNLVLTLTRGWGGGRHCMRQAEPFCFAPIGGLFKDLLCQKSWSSSGVFCEQCGGGATAGAWWGYNQHCWWVTPPIPPMGRTCESIIWRIWCSEKRQYIPYLTEANSPISFVNALIYSL